ncbi:MAG: orotate phosphoribosyltransferase [Candidatus Zixiibacteriota bacterium]|nr:MAG: orotate phosphoribosyltransferase [candidate division Zixibacteria bacterium]
MNQEDVLQLFKQSNALLSGHFKLSSGRHSDIYYEKFTLLKQPSLCTRICEEMARRFSGSGAVTVVGPTTGGIIIAYDVARYMGIEAIYAEPGDQGRVFKRGFSLDRGQKIVIVDDVLTTGRSVFEVIDLVKRYQANIVGIGLMLDRSNGTVVFEYPYFALAKVSAESWAPDECPLCAQGIEITQRGSRKFRS